MVIAVYNNKGGVGKTSLVSHVAFRAMEMKKTVTILDADQQSNAMQWITNGQWDGNSTVSLGTVTATIDYRETIDSDFTVIDCPPAFEVVKKFPQVDIWIVPVSCRFSVTGALNVIDEIKKHSKNSKVVLVANMVDVRTVFGQTEIDEIKKVCYDKNMDIVLFRCAIPRHDIVAKAEMLCVPSWSIPYGTRSTTTSNLKLFAEWLLSGFDKKGTIHSSEDEEGTIYG